MLAFLTAVKSSRAIDSILIVIEKIMVSAMVYGVCVDVVTASC